MVLPNPISKMKKESWSSNKNIFIDEVQWSYRHSMHEPPSEELDHKKRNTKAKNPRFNSSSLLIKTKQLSFPKLTASSSFLPVSLPLFQIHFSLLFVPSSKTETYSTFSSLFVLNTKPKKINSFFLARFPSTKKN